MIQQIGDNCVGCGSCTQSCPKMCINMVYDKEGFLRPVVDINLCLNCGVCLKSCPSYKGNPMTTFQTEVGKEGVYGVKLQEEADEVLNSASAGFVYYIAKSLILAGGVIYGASLENNSVAHIKIDNIFDLRKIQNSKYVQSDLRNTYSEIKSQLETDSITPVLFTGTPCQVAGLKFFLNKEYSNLICIDFICHGVPSSLLLKKYIGWLQEKIGSPITDYLFRSKVKGWNYNGRMVSYVSANNRYWPSVRDPYLTCFLRAYNYRESCYRCEFNSKFKFADFTVGDFAGCREKYPSFFDRKGCSVVLVNTQKGLVYFDRYRGLFDYIEITLNDVIKFNPNLNSPCTRPKERDKIYESILQYSDQEYVEKKLMCYLNGKDTINFYLPVKFKEFLKKLLHI